MPFISLNEFNTAEASDVKNLLGAVMPYESSMKLQSLDFGGGCWVFSAFFLRSVLEQRLSSHTALLGKWKQDYVFFLPEFLPSMPRAVLPSGFVGLGPHIWWSYCALVKFLRHSLTWDDLVVLRWHMLIQLVQQWNSFSTMCLTLYFSQAQTRSLRSMSFFFVYRKTNYCKTSYICLLQLYRGEFLQCFWSV